MDYFKNYFFEHDLAFPLLFACNINRQKKDESRNEKIPWYHLILIVLKYILNF